MDDAAQRPGEDDSAGQSELDLSFLSAANATFIAEMNTAWRQDPGSVDSRWAAYFNQLDALGDVDGDVRPSWAQTGSGWSMGHCRSG